MRDAQGNTLALYDNQNCFINWKEQQLYGSSRLGMWTPNLKLTDTVQNIAAWDSIGKKQFELGNHLGNVLAVVSDKRIFNGSGTYEAEVVSAQDYYPFGMMQPGRSWSLADSYRYGFNGKENDNEVKGTGNQIDYGNRIYDPRIGRWLSTDPLQKKYPDLSPYNFAGNNPIVFIDYDGKDFGLKIDHDAKTIIVVANIYTTNQAGYDQALKSSGVWNASSATLEGYVVSFQIKVMAPTKSPMSSEDLVKQNPASYTNKRGKVNQSKVSTVLNRVVENAAGQASNSDDVGNVFAGNSSVYSKNVSGDSFVGGVTANGKHIGMNTHSESGDMGQFSDLVTHELGHLFGLDDEKDKTYFSPDGIMKYKGTSLNPISKNDIANILKFAKDALHGRTGSNDAKVKLTEQKGSSNGNNPIGVTNIINE